MARVGGLSTSVVSGRFWCVAVLSAAGAISTASRADATLYYSQDSEPGFDRPASSAQARRQKLRHSGKKDAVEKETAAKPQGPLVIAVSINKQQVKIYDANGFFAQAPVSTGMAGHSTPMGVFSVIQKHKLHHSNIYSNAPMPFMQRITWSGVALHAGVLPGYPASHGCIRMPMGFAVKMWNWTKMGARVVVTPGEIAPSSFSHRLLPSLKVAPQPVVAEAPRLDATAAAKADKRAPDTKASTGATSVELRSTVGHSSVMASVADITPVTLRDQTHTADAADARSMVTMSDARSDNSAPSRDDRGAANDGVKTADSVKADSSDADGATPPQTPPLDAKPDEAAASAAKPVEPAATETKPIPVTASDKPIDTKTDAPKQDTAKIEPAQDHAKDSVKDSTKSSDKPADAVKADDDAGASAPDGKKDQTRLAKPDAPKRNGQIAVFISRKDSKIYVRQNFAPLFEAPATIAPSDRPLGTHIFTADVDKTDANALHWSVVSLPMSVRSLMRGNDETLGSHRRKSASAEAKPLPVADSPAEALDRITIPADTMARISEALTTGGSIIVSDQGINQGETGEGTDFIVSLR
jgi:lipoprotein-anchoring transpeptidase ErfK/SrfK